MPLLSAASLRRTLLFMSSIDFIAHGLARIDQDLDFLIGCFGEVLVEMGQSDLAACLPWSSRDDEQTSSTKPVPLPERGGQALALAFQLLNMVEENAAAQTRRDRERHGGMAAERGLWGYNLRVLHEAGFDPEQIAEVMQRVSVEPVLTAHPTEAKRLSVIEGHRALFRLLEKRDNPLWTPAEQDAIRDEIKALLECIWRTGEVLLHKPAVADERRNVLHYLVEIFPTVLRQLDWRLQQAWREAGFDEELLEGPGKGPHLRFGTWVGGDRDGHPLVTDEVTRQTLADLRLNALVLLHEQLGVMAQQLSLSNQVQTPPPAFLRAVVERAERLGDIGRRILATNTEEPWRQFAALLRESLPLHIEPGEAGTLSMHGSVYRFSAELMTDLQLLHDSLVEVGAPRVANAEVVPVMRAVKVFGFHLARLDVRQNSAFHDKALGQLMVAARLDGASFPEWSEAERLRFLDEELRSPRPFLHSYEVVPTMRKSDGVAIGEEADTVMSCYRVLAHHIHQCGSNGLGALVVSMTRNLSDLLTVYVLAREAGLTVNTPMGLVCRLPVVPLFETLDDLQGAGRILRAFLEHPVTRRSLAAQSPDGILVQQVMVGYSDSNKDAGIFASQWSLHQAQAQIAAVGRECGVEIRFFHGRGGTISRGAGPTHRFLEALPQGSLTGKMRLTEQGETFAQKYANLTTATYNLEVLLAGVTATTLRHKYRPTPPHPLQPITDQLAKWSREDYKNLLNAPGFMDFYSQATPIDALEHSRIGSRPARRTGRKTIADLRAIPWVFAWNQARFYVPGWYSVGYALCRLMEEQPDSFEQLTAQIKSWPFLRYLLTNVETTLASADLGLMEHYASLVKSDELRERFMTMMREEFHRTESAMEKIFGDTFEIRRPRMYKTLQLRARALRRLHFEQIELLRTWRDYTESGDTEAADAMLPQLLLSINAIASGLRTTG